MTLQEKIKITSETYLLAKEWKTEFVVSQFQNTWFVQRSIESNPAYSLMQKTLMIEQLQAKRKAYSRIMSERKYL